MKIKKTLSRVGAGALMAATVAAGLSFGVAPASAASASLPQGKLAWQGYSVSSSNVSGSDRVAAQQNYNGGNFQLPRVGTTGNVRNLDNGKCLAFYDSSNGGARYQPCTTAGNQQFSFTREGLLKNVATGTGPTVYYNSTQMWVGANARGGKIIDTSVVKNIFNATVTKQDLAGRTATFTGTGVPGATILINDRFQTTVGSNGQWTYEVPSLGLGKNTVKLEQYEGDNNKTDSFSVVVDLNVALVTATAQFDADRTKLATVSGTAQAGATVELVNMSGEVVGSTTAASPSGRYTIDVPAPNAGGTQQFKVQQKVNGELDSSVANVDVNYGNAVRIDTPVANAIATGKTTFSGVGAGGGQVRIQVKGQQGIIASGDVLVNSTWHLDNIDVPDRKVTYVVTQVSKGNNVTTSEVTLNPDADYKDVTLTSPVSGSQFDANTSVTFRGEGAPGATITVDPGAGLSAVTTKVGDNGQWSVAKYLGNGKYTFTIKQEATNGKTSFVNNVVLTPKSTAPINKPFKITSPAAGSNHQGQLVTFTGEGKAGETVTLHVTNFASADVTAKVDNNGNWSAQKFLGTGAYAFDITQSGTNDVVRDFRLNQAAAGQDKPFAVTNAPSGEVATGLYTFSGTGKVGATVKLEPTTGQSAATAVVDGEGKWSVQKFIGTSKYDFKVSMTKDGKTETLANIVVTGK